MVANWPSPAAWYHPSNTLCNARFWSPYPGESGDLSPGGFTGWDDPDLTLVALRIPKGVVCLISALAFHNLTTQIPHQVHVALPKDAEKPRLDFPPVKFFWLSQSVFSAGIEEHTQDGVPLRVYSVEKSLADCFKFRNKIGLDVALEALKAYRNTQGFDSELLLHYARIDRVERVILPYLEALV